MRMRYTNVLLAALCCAASAASAQSNPAGDPISGSWKGDIGLDETTRNPVTFQLRFDGTSAISGTVTGPGTAVLKSGSFNPRTGAFRLELDVSDDTRSNPFIFEGIAVKGMITGRVSGNSQTGTFRLAREGAAPVAGPSESGAAGAGFEVLRGWVLKAAQAVPADKYAYQPIRTVRTFGQMIAHIIDGSNYYCGGAASGQAQWSDANEKGAVDKATILPKLEQALAACSSQYSGNGQPAGLVANLAHTSLHYGNIVTYMRMLGLTPPSS
jgi:uncharacterized damage-inducible protein DinB